jgi:hypothetical protein
MEKNGVLHLLENADWKDIILKLTHYALQRARVYSWKSGKSDQLLGGKTPEDIAFEAIEKVLSGTRDWNPDKYPNLLTHLQWVVKSDMEHLASSMEHQATGRMPEPGEGEEGYETIPDPSSPTPEEDLIAREKEDLEERLKGELYAMVKGDEDLETLLLCFDEGIDKPEIIAAQTGWDVSKVYNLKRKLLRKASKLGVNPQ